MRYFLVFYRQLDGVEDAFYTIKIAGPDAYQAIYDYHQKLVLSGSHYRVVAVMDFDPNYETNQANNLEMVTSIFADEVSGGFHLEEEEYQQIFKRPPPRRATSKTIGPRKPPPVIPYEIFQTKKPDPDKCWNAVLMLCGDRRADGRK